jgi:hypothetical protein
MLASVGFCHKDPPLPPQGARYEYDCCDCGAHGEIVVVVVRGAGEAGKDRCVRMRALNKKRGGGFNKQNMTK